MDSHLHASEELDCMQISHSVKCHMNELISQCPNVLCNKNSLIIVTQNIVSIYKNLDDLQANLSILNLEADILVLTECRLESNKQIPLLRNYTSYQTSKLLNQNDGVVVYICNKHRAKVTELLLSDASGLQVVIENLVLLCIYRSPSFLNSRNFVSSLDAHLETIKRYKHISILADVITNQAGRRSSGSVVTTPNPISSNPSSFILLDTDVREVESVLMNLDSGSSPGWDEFVVPHICKLANLCFNTGVFPSSLKRSIVTPVYKSGDRADILITGSSELFPTQVSFDYLSGKLGKTLSYIYICVNKDLVDLIRCRKIFSEQLSAIYQRASSNERK
ncbi:hypothetical protein ABMA28_006285 [Loxostege sticticalis]|uniref:Vacuolar fusion protein MON1 homolog n=1 Tax=Loxostege sticticalis TaxID=481309 RepID=A0ABD0SMX2_LOXSC